MATILWCYSRNDGFIKDGVDYNTAADITGQANYLGVSIQADIIKQKLPTNNGGFTAIKARSSNPLHSATRGFNPLSRHDDGRKEIDYDGY